MCSLLGFGLPAYLWYYRRTLNSFTEEESQRLNEKDSEKAGDESSFDDEPAPYVSSIALAL